mgnify:CR=1 FL=1
MNQEVRKLPKKTVLIITIMTVIAIGGFVFLQSMKEQKMTEIIATLGHKNISDMEVINKLSVEDKETRYKSKVFKVRFFDKNLNKTCIGFIHIGRNNEYSKYLDCK